MAVSFFVEIIASSFLQIPDCLSHAVKQHIIRDRFFQKTKGKGLKGFLVSNSLSYGLGTLFIVQKGNTLTFSNKVKDPGSIDPDQMFVRFYRGDPSRNASKSSHAGLGLSIARELTQAMGGKIEARLHEDILEIVLTFQGISR